MSIDQETVQQIMAQHHHNMKAAGSMDNGSLPFKERGGSGMSSPQSHIASTVDTKSPPEPVQTICLQKMILSQHESPPAVSLSSQGQDRGDNRRVDIVDRDDGCSSHSEDIDKWKIKEEPENPQPNIVGLDQWKQFSSSTSSSNLTTSSPSSCQSQAKVPARGKAESSRPSLQDVITHLAHSVSGQSGVSTTPPTSSTASILTLAVSAASSVDAQSAGASLPSSDRIPIKCEEAPSVFSGGAKKPEEKSVLSPHSVPPVPEVLAKPAGRGKGRERRSKGDGNLTQSRQPHTMIHSSSQQVLVSPIVSGMAPRMPVNGAAFSGMPVAFDTNLSYDYSLPDRGLGTAAFPTMSPGFPAVSPNLMGYYQGMGVPLTPWKLGNQPSVPSVAMDASSGAIPLDLSASHKASSRSHGMAGDTHMSSSAPPSRNTAAPKARSESDRKRKLMEKLLEKSENESPVASEPTLEPPESKPRYTKNMLIFGEKEVEIISVERNRWIVRNEQELKDSVRRMMASQPCHQDKPSPVTACDSVTGSDCECVHYTSDVKGETAEKKETVRDDCECVSSSVKRNGHAPSACSPKQNGSEEVLVQDEAANKVVSKLKTSATSSTESEEARGEQGHKASIIPSQSAMKIDLSSHEDRVLCPADHAVVNLCEEDNSDSKKFPVLHQMLQAFK